MVRTVWESSVEICYKTVNMLILFSPINCFNTWEIISRKQSKKKQAKNVCFRILKKNT